MVKDWRVVLRTNAPFGLAYPERSFVVNKSGRHFSGTEKVAILMPKNEVMAELTEEAHTELKSLGISQGSEEILGAMVCNVDADRVTLFAKAAAELLDQGQTADSANRQLQDLRNHLEKLL
jgi:hypothetical protein